VTFDGRWETVTGAGLCPMPVQQPIPIWVGATSEKALLRAGRLADGWFPQAVPGHGLEEAQNHVRRGAEGAGRDPGTLGMEGRLNGASSQEKTADHLERWKKAGATHISINTMGAGLAGPDEHIEALRKAAEVALA
jgi:hypothetical protein